MRFPDHEIRQNLTHSVRAHTGKSSDISSDVTESDNLKQDAAFNLCIDNDLRMTVPLVSGTFFDFVEGAIERLHH
jgi:hypothetical protein